MSKHESSNLLYKLIFDFTALESLLKKFKTIDLSLKMQKEMEMRDLDSGMVVEEFTCQNSVACTVKYRDPLTVLRGQGALWSIRDFLHM